MNESMYEQWLASDCKEVVIKQSGVDGLPPPHQEVMEFAKWLESEHDLKVWVGDWKQSIYFDEPDVIAHTYKVVRKDNQ